MKFIKQYKGKALEAIPLSKRHSGNEYYLSTKYDGQMVQIAYDGYSQVNMWSSNGHPFYDAALANYITKNQTYAFHVEAEYVGESEGKLGDRGKSSKITTYRTEFSKGILSEGSDTAAYKVFDILSFDGQDVRQDPFSARYAMLMQLASNGLFNVIDHDSDFSLNYANDHVLAAYLVAGWEGVILTHKDHVINTTGRSNDRIKLKATPTGYATIIGFTPGTEARKGTIGSLELVDENGLEFSSGGGLNANEWTLDPKDLIGITVKFGYESIKDGNYQQPRYQGAVDADKNLMRLDEYLNQSNKET